VAETAIFEDSVVARARDVIATEVDGEAVVMSIERGQCYGFDAIGSRVWSLIEQPIKVREVCALLQGEFEVDDATCRRDVTRLLAELAREDLIVIGNEQSR
jgi:Coenzyme PQQ synthesis protein D (PqqD)